MSKEEEILTVWAASVADDILRSYEIAFASNGDGANDKIDPREALRSRIIYRLIATAQGKDLLAVRAKDGSLKPIS